MVMLSYAAAARDPRYFENPHEVDIDRKIGTNIAFGYGPHRCIGSHLARLQALTTMEEMLRRMPDVRVKEGHEPTFSHSTVTRDMLSLMQEGSVIVDVAVDQGGCVETIKPTTHDDPVYTIDGVIHYGVANMPGGVPRTSTLALTNATLPYALKLANKGWKQALAEDPALLKGLNVVDGKVTYQGVAEAFGMEYHEASKFIK